jgi:hypothetical protein
MTAKQKESESTFLIEPDADVWLEVMWGETSSFGRDLANLREKKASFIGAKGPSRREREAAARLAVHGMSALQ